MVFSFVDIILYPVVFAPSDFSNVYMGNHTRFDIYAFIKLKKKKKGIGCNIAKDDVRKQQIIVYGQY